MTERFFEERQEQSEAKARIVSKYFSAWARVIMPSAQRNGGKIAYIDLYAGPGRYKDGAASTSPLKKALLTGFHSTAKHNATKAVSPSSETMRTI